MLKEEMLETVKITSMSSLEEWTRQLAVLLAFSYWKFDIFCFLLAMIKLENSFSGHKYEQSVEKFNLIFFLDFDSR